MYTWAVHVDTKSKTMISTRMSAYKNPRIPCIYPALCAEAREHTYTHASIHTVYTCMHAYLQIHSSSSYSCGVQNKRRIAHVYRAPANCRDPGAKNLHVCVCVCAHMHVRMLLYARACARACQLTCTLFERICAHVRAPVYDNPKAKHVHSSMHVRACVLLRAHV